MSKDQKEKCAALCKKINKIMDDHEKRMRDIRSEINDALGNQK